MPKTREQTIIEYWPLVKGIAFNMCRNKGFTDKTDDCQSIAGEAMIHAIDSYNPVFGASLKTWIIRTVQFSVLDSLQKDKLKGAFLDIETLKNSKELSVNGTEAKIIARDLISKILFHIDRHKNGRKRQGEKEALIAYFFDGQLMKEIAEWRGCTVPNVSMMLSKLQGAVLDEFGSDAP